MIVKFNSLYDSDLIQIIFEDSKQLPPGYIPVLAGNHHITRHLPQAYKEIWEKCVRCICTGFKTKILVALVKTNPLGSDIRLRTNLLSIKVYTFQKKSMSR